MHARTQVYTILVSPQNAAEMLTATLLSRIPYPLAISESRFFIVISTLPHPLTTIILLQ